MENNASTRTQPALHIRSAPEIKRTIEAERAGLPFLVWRDADGTQQIFTLEARRRLTIGRRSSNDIVLGSDGEVSRVHAELEPIGGDWVVADLGLSSNGTFIKEERISGRRRLDDGDLLRFGKTLIEYRRPVAGSTVLTSSASSPPYAGRLTDMQRAILVALARPYKSGASFVTPAKSTVVAKEVGLSLDAVKGHLSVLYHLFEIAHLAPNQKRARLVECAFQWGLLSERDL
jgi:hypothetical protein